MSALWIVLGVVAYLAIGLGVVYMLGIRSDHNEWSPDFGPLLVGVFWPIVAPVVLVLAVVGGLANVFAWAANKGAKR